MNAIVLVALRRPYTFVVLAILILLFGIMAALKTPTDIFPNIRTPVVATVWSYSGLMPEDMSGRVVYYFERQLPRLSVTLSTSKASLCTGVASSKSFFSREQISRPPKHKSPLCRRPC